MPDNLHAYLGKVHAPSPETPGETACGRTYRLDGDWQGRWDATDEGVECVTCLDRLMIHKLTAERDEAVARADAIAERAAERSVHGTTELLSVTAERDAAAQEAATLREAAQAVCDGVTAAGRRDGESAHLFRLETVVPLVRLQEALRTSPTVHAKLAAARAEVAMWAAELVNDDTPTSQDAYAALCEAVHALAEAEEAEKGDG